MLFDRYWTHAWRAAYAVTADRTLADDAAQEAMTKAFGALRPLRRDAAVRAVAQADRRQPRDRPPPAGPAARGRARRRDDVPRVVDRRVRGGGHPPVGGRRRRRRARRRQARRHRSPLLARPPARGDRRRSSGFPSAPSPRGWAGRRPSFARRWRRNVSSELERLLREAREQLARARDGDVTDARAPASRAPPSGAGRPRARAVAASSCRPSSSLRSASALGTLIAPSGTASQGPAGLGFLPEDGWYVMQAGTDATPRATRASRSPRTSRSARATAPRSSGSYARCSAAGRRDRDRRQLHRPDRGCPLVRPELSRQPAFPQDKLPLRIRGRDPAPVRRPDPPRGAARPVPADGPRERVRGRPPLLLRDDRAVEPARAEAQRQLNKLVVRAGNRTGPRAVPSATHASRPTVERGRRRARPHVRVHDRLARRRLRGRDARARRLPLRLELGEAAVRGRLDRRCGRLAERQPGRARRTSSCGSRAGNPVARDDRRHRLLDLPGSRVGHDRRTPGAVSSLEGARPAEQSRALSAARRRRWGRSTTASRLRRCSSGSAPGSARRATCKRRPVFLATSIPTLDAKLDRADALRQAARVRRGLPVGPDAVLHRAGVREGLMRRTGSRSGSHADSRRRCSLLAGVGSGAAQVVTLTFTRSYDDRLQLRAAKPPARSRARRRPGGARS